MIIIIFKNIYLNVMKILRKVVLFLFFIFKNTCHYLFLPIDAVLCTFFTCTFFPIPSLLYLFYLYFFCRLPNTVNGHNPTGKKTPGHNPTHISQYLSFFFYSIKCIQSIYICNLLPPYDIPNQKRKALNP